MACTVALMLSNSFLLWRDIRLGTELNRAYGPISASRAGFLLESPYPVAQRGEDVIGRAPGRYAVVYMLTRFDAPFASADASDLRTIVRSRADVSAFVVLAYAHQAMADRFASQNHLDCPVLEDADGSRLQTLDPPRTPWWLVFDLATRELLCQDGPAAGGRAPDELVKFVQSLPARGRG